MRYLLIASAVLLTGCIPYSVSTTAAPAPEGRLSQSMVFAYVPFGAETYDDETPTYTALPTMDLEVRYGIDEHSDVGLRAPSGSGFVMNYKRRVRDSMTGPSVALMGGLGIVNFGMHAFGEANLLISAPESDRLTPYGGLRAMHVLPINPGASRDTPTIGTFIGVRIGSTDLGVSPEIGVFYDEPAIDFNVRGPIIVVPSITLHGGDLLRIFRRW